MYMLYMDRKSKGHTRCNMTKGVDTFNPAILILQFLEHARYSCFRDFQ